MESNHFICIDNNGQYYSIPSYNYNDVFWNEFITVHKNKICLLIEHE